MAVGGKNHGSGKGRRKRRPRPPWGRLLGGKSIESNAQEPDDALNFGAGPEMLQYIKMLKLKTHYGIYGGDYEFPIRGVGAATWLPWYQLALAIASDVDDSLKIIDVPPRGKTARRWRGDEGKILVQIVETLKTSRPRLPTVNARLKWLQSKNPNSLGQMSFSELQARYYEALKYHRSKK